MRPSWLREIHTYIRTPTPWESKSERATARPGHQLPYHVFAQKSEGAAAASAVAARCICRLREQELKEDAKLVSQSRIWQKYPLSKKKWNKLRIKWNTHAYCGVIIIISFVSNQQLQHFNLQLKNNHSDIWIFSHLRSSPFVSFKWKSYYIWVFLSVRSSSSSSSYRYHALSSSLCSFLLFFLLLCRLLSAIVELFLFRCSCCCCFRC